MSEKVIASGAKSLEIGWEFVVVVYNTVLSSVVGEGTGAIHEPNSSFMYVGEKNIHHLLNKGS